ncbi:hypothetical protein [Vogesella indigofera]|uniref:hypothetical protein n=1 Tax=Vogesella indigofera TaxID=45465 RepID=UPI003F423400
MTSNEAQRLSRINDQGWPQALPGFLYPLRGCFLAAAFRAAAGYFLLLRQKKVPKEKATRRCQNSRENWRHPGAAHPLRSKGGGLFPG